MRLLLTGLLLVGFCATSFAQNKENDWAVGAQIGVYEYNGDFSNEMLKYQDLTPNVSFSFSKYINASFDIYAFASFGKLDSEYSSITFSGNFNAYSLNARWKFLKESDMVAKSWVPFLGVGVGLATSDVKGASSMISTFNAPVSLGLEYHFTERFAANARFVYNFTSSDEVDGVIGAENAWEETDDVFHQSVGVTYSFALASDMDGDGVTDKKDRCPEVAGLPALQGCPDTDLDGIADRDDFCPNVPGVREFKGCPDTDGDGIPDKLDACPGVAGPEALQGCPDSDGDGVVDGKDWCPQVAGTVGTNGCPDTDGDGIVDKDDVCPDVAGIAANKGCPEMKDLLENVENGMKTISFIHFSTNSAVLSANDIKELDRIVRILKENNDFTLVVEGHTDDAGDAEMNTILSKRRVDAVTNYLKRNNINAERYSTVEFGEDNPIVPNNTEAGRAKNRRVVLKLTK